jgi:hypothetical protein
LNKDKVKVKAKENVVYVPKYNVTKKHVGVEVKLHTFLTFALSGNEL